MMIRLLTKALILAAMLIGLPLAGIWLDGKPIHLYLEFPPRTQYVQHARFSWFAFWCLAVLISSCILALTIFVHRGNRQDRKMPPSKTPRFQFPWWGWAGLICLIAAWILAWSRFEWFSSLQEHTFLPLWIGYILVVNGLCHRKAGHCMLADRPAFFLTLFPVSAAFWWFFEYLNRFVQNWYYRGVLYGPWEYFWLATLSFSTVLPAVLSTRDWLLASGRLSWRLDHLKPLAIPRRIPPALAMLVPAAAGLTLIGVVPDYLFGLLWVSPLLIITALQVLWREPHVFSEMAEGRWSNAVAACLAALFCGFFWEMWNFFSFAKWQYSIPFVHRFQIFEMPVLGYAGYLPFGLECAAIGLLIEGFFGRHPLPPAGFSSTRHLSSQGKRSSGRYPHR